MNYMNVSKGKKERQGRSLFDGGAKSSKVVDEEKENKKFKRATTIVLAVLAVLIVVTILARSNLLYSTFTAVEVGDSRYTVADVNYYYQLTYNYYYSNYYSTYGEYAKYFMPKEDDLQSAAITTLTEVDALCSEAKKAGYTLSTDGQKTVSSTIDELSSTATSNGYSSAKAYLVAAYGKGMTEKIFEKNLTAYTLANEYTQQIKDSYSYTDDQLSDYYSKNKDSLDVINYRVYTISAATNADGSYDMDSATAKANDFLSGVTGEDSFATQAYAFADDSSKNTYEDNNATLKSSAGSGLSSTYSSWLLDSSRKAGDTTYIEGTNSVYVLYFVSRDTNDYNTVDVRHILFSFDTYKVDSAAADTSDTSDTSDTTAADTSTTDTSSDTVSDATKAAAYAAAEEAYQEWKDGDATEDSFAALADEKSSDSAEGGLYEHVYKNEMTANFNDWCFSSFRKPGDTAIIETDYGYHVMYFIGSDMKYCDYLADTSLRTQDFNTWEKGLLENDYVSHTTWLLNLAK